MAEGVITQGQGPRCIDLSGYIILPGLVDFHGDGFERHVAPRRGAVVDPREGIRPIEAELAANGITTAMLAQFYSWEGGMRGPDFAAAMARALQHAQGLICDLRLQLRVEMNMVDHYAAILDLVRDHQIACVVFNDHLPHEALAAGKRPPRLTGQALKAGRSPEAHLAFLHSLHDRKPEVMPALRDLAGQLSELGVVMGSHDDATPATHAQFSEIGVSLAEFPETVEAAEAARAEGHGVVMGAPNVLRGGSHAGKVSARLLVEAGLVDALASDYHYPALLRAALTLWQGGMGLTEAWALVSSGPARLLGLQDRGEIATGKRADFVILDAKSHAVAATIAGAQIAYARGDIVQRLLS
jgi:alpha-D-ribose 1-methylphosphonate 5-triphosphate diphosphatase